MRAATLRRFGEFAEPVGKTVRGSTERRAASLAPGGGGVDNPPMASTVRPRVQAVGLMERGGALAALRGALAEVRAGSGRMVLLNGEAGIGKTAIVEAFTGEAGAPVLLGGCDPIEAPRPLGPFLDALATSTGEPPGTAQAAFAALRTAAGESPAVLVLEDMHWADEASLDVLRLTGRRIESLPLLVIATYREDGLGRDHQLRVVLGDIAGAREVSRIRLEPLTEAAVAELCRGSDRDPAAVHRLTGGNPFFVSELLDAGGDAVPETVSDAVLARAARLDRESKQMLELISISPLPLDLSLLERVAAGLAGLDGCLTSGLLDEHAGVVRFRHELARMAVERSLPAVRRRDLHALLLSGLAGADDPERLAILAHHAEGAGDAAAVLRYASAAATQAGRCGAHREEARQYARALRHADGLPAADRARLHLLHADALYATDLQAESIDAGLRAAACAEEAGEVATQAEAIARLAPRYLCRGEMEQAGQAATRAQELLAHGGDSLQLATLYAVMAQIALCRDDFAGTVQWATRAAALARRYGDEQVALDAELSAGTAEGLLTGRAGPLEEALARARSVGSSAEIPRALNNLAQVAVVHRRHESAACWIREGLEHCADHDLDLWWLSIRWLQARSLLDRGDGRRLRSSRRSSSTTRATHRSRDSRVCWCRHRCGRGEEIPACRRR
jgi:tetratricopeptide (TPR) repeat protein